MPPNIADGVEYPQPVELPERRGMALMCRESLNLTIPTVLDSMTNAVDEMYAGFPERIFVIDRRGRVAYAGKVGPWGFEPSEAETALLRLR